MCVKALQTETQVVVKREDEMAFAELNGSYLKFVEDAARLLYEQLVKDERIKLLKDNEFGEEDVITMLKKAISMAEDKKDVSNYMRCVENIQDMLGMRDKDKVIETTQIEASTTRRLIDEIAEEEKKHIATNKKETDE